MIASSCVDFNHSLLDLGSHFTQPVIWVSGRAGRKVAGVLLALLGGGFTGVQSMGSPGTCEKNCDPMKPCDWCAHRKLRKLGSMFCLQFLSGKSGTMDNQTTAVDLDFRFSSFCCQQIQQSCICHGLVSQRGVPASLYNQRSLFLWVEITTFAVYP